MLDGCQLYSLNLVKSTPGGRDDEKFFSSDYEVFGELEMDKDIGAVVVGYDCTFNYYKLAKASIVLQ